MEYNGSALQRASAAMLFQEQNMLRKTFPILLLFLVLSSSWPGAAQAEGSLPVLVGFYPSAELYRTVNEIDALNAYFGGNIVSIAGTFLDLESPAWLIYAELEAAWSHGYVPFVNLGAGTIGVPRSAQAIANGEIDAAIRNWARTYKAWSYNGVKKAFLAPLQEMNGNWRTYYGDPLNYRRAFVRIRQIFQEEGVVADSVSWVFAPNGWHDPANPSDAFENYYPGNSVVDVVGFSSFNFGDCWPYTDSQSFEEIYKPYLDRMAAMAPGKPIFIAEIASVAYGLDRAAWFSDTLSKVGAYPGVRAILYFNRSEDPANYLYPPVCSRVDYSLDASPDGQGGPAAEGKDAFKEQVTHPPYGYWAKNSVEMNTIAFGRPTATFEDVWPASVFSGKSTTPYYFSWVERLVNTGITSGCMATTVDFDGVTDFTYRYYCPENPVTRAQMAVFLEKGLHYPNPFTPPDLTPTFNDTAGHWAENWIEALRNDGITAGCGNGKYCPDDAVTRAQMAVFLLRSMHGVAYTPPPATGTVFEDVPADHWAAAWIEQLAREGITSGCSSAPPAYCPEQAVTRGQMAVFLVRTFQLP